MNQAAYTVDLETKSIESRPYYPPVPVGVAVRDLLGNKTYYAFGHTEGNNCDVGKAQAVVKDIYRSGMPVIFHNNSFDTDVIETHWGLSPPSTVEDTLYLAFLQNPHEKELALKPLAEIYLDMPPAELDLVKDWVLSNVPAAKKKPSSWGEHMWKCPPKILGPYAIGDVDRTYKLWKKIKPEITERGMLPAYQRELSLTPITLEMERSGVRVDMDRLKDCLGTFEKMDKDLVRRICKRLRISKHDMDNPDVKKRFNVDSGPQLAKALIAADKLESIIRTPTGKVSTKVENLRSGCSDKRLLDLLAVHSVIKKYTSSFIIPWIEQGELTDGRVLPRFNQTRQDEGGGARSGRMSSYDPNFQNVAGNVEESKNKDTLLLMQSWARDQFGYEFIGLRDFIIPDEDSVLITVDYNQQELRLLAHFERGILMKAYRDNPKLDVHDFCRVLVGKILGIDIPRKAIKVTVFGLIYGMGLDKLAHGMGLDKNTAKNVRDGILKAIPGIKDLVDELKSLERRGKPLRTWGGREYYCEEPKYLKNKQTGEEFWMSFEYKMLNYLIQPSAADVTKQGMINVKRDVPRARIALQVHDELVCMAPKASYGRQIADAMCDINLNVPMLADPKVSDFSWARAK